MQKMTLSVVVMFLCSLMFWTTAPAVAAGKNSRTVVMKVTGYCPCKECCGKNAKGITASGKPVTANGGKFCAAPPEYPFGTKISVPGYNEGKAIPVLDRGSAIKGNHIDLFFKTHKEAREWGVRRLNVTVYK